MDKKDKAKDGKVEDSKEMLVPRRATSYGIYCLYTLCVIIAILSLVSDRAFTVVSIIFVLICFSLFMKGYLKDERGK